MAETNTAPPSGQSTEQPSDFMSKVGAQLREVYDFGIKILVTVFYTVIQPYVFFYHFGKSFLENFRDLIKIGTLSIRAALLYLQVWIRLLNGLNKDDKPAETVIQTVKNIGTAVNNIYKRLQDDRGNSSTHRSETSVSTFPPIAEGNESTSDDESGNSSRYHEESQHSAESRGTRGDTGQPQEPSRNGSGSGGGGSNGGSSGGSSSRTGGNGSPPNSGQGKAVTFKEEPANTGSSTPRSSGSTGQSSGGTTSASSQQGVDEVDKSKTSPKPNTVPPPTRVAATAR